MTNKFYQTNDSNKDFGNNNHVEEFEDLIIRLNKIKEVISAIDKTFVEK